MAEEKKKILYAEDYESLRIVTMNVLQKEFSGYSIEQFADGSLLEDRLKQGAENIRLVLLDHNMPGKKGIDIIREYSRTKDFIRIPFVLYFSDKEHLGYNALIDGAFAYVPKGIAKIGDLIFTLRKALKYAEVHAEFTESLQ